MCYSAIDEENSYISRTITRIVFLGEDDMSDLNMIEFPTLKWPKDKTDRFFRDNTNRPPYYDFLEEW